MTIRVYSNRITFLGDSENDREIEMLIESDGLRFTSQFIAGSSREFLYPSEINTPMQGTINGFVNGGATTPPFVGVNYRERFAFVSDGSVFTDGDVGDLSYANYGGNGHSSDTHGFVSGGFTQDPGSPTRLKQIDKYPFAATSGTATDAGDLAVETSYHGGHSSREDGFTSGGLAPSPPRISTIQRFPFSISGGVADEPADLVAAKQNVASYSSEFSGFTSGGNIPAQVTTIEKFPFVLRSTTATEVGDLAISSNAVGGGISSQSEGFMTGGSFPPLTRNVIQKFPYGITSGTSTDVGDLSTPRSSHGTTQTVTKGFTVNGFSPTIPGTTRNVDVFPFSISSGTATSHVDLFYDRYNTQSTAQD